MRLARAIAPSGLSRGTQRSAAVGKLFASSSLLMPRPSHTIGLFFASGLALSLGFGCGSGDQADGTPDGGGEGGLGGEGGDRGNESLGGAGTGGRKSQAGGESSADGGSSAGGVLCGNEIIEAPEECDPPNGDTCTQECHLPKPVCGNKVREIGEACDPPNGETCDAECQIIPIACGNGIKQASEECDPPDDKTCDDNCYWIECGDFEVQGEEECDPPSGLTCDEQCKAIPAECGDTIVQPSEQCDPPNGKSCGEDCQLTSVVNFCPSVYVFGSPSVATVGGDPIAIDALASDSDGDPLTYFWQATSGALSSVTAPSILVTCTEPGPMTIQVRVRDSDPNCDVTGIVIPNCVAP